MNEQTLMSTSKFMMTNGVPAIYPVWVFWPGSETGGMLWFNTFGRPRPIGGRKRKSGPCSFACAATCAPGEFCRLATRSSGGAATAYGLPTPPIQATRRSWPHGFSEPLWSLSRMMRSATWRRSTKPAGAVAREAV